MGKNRGRRRRGDRERPHIPQRAEQLTAEWFTEVLATGATVTAVRCAEIGAGVGFMGEVHRCHLTWDRAAPGSGADALPTSVIVKVPTQVDENFAIGDALKSYEREIVVYQTLRPTLGLPVPRHYHSAMDPDPAPWFDRPVLFMFDHLPIRGINWAIDRLIKIGGRSKRRYVLVIEDVTDARPPSQFTGGSLDDAHRALELLARFHAHNWMRADVRASYSRIWHFDRAHRAFQASYVRNRDRFVERFGAAVGADTMAHLDDIQRRVPEISAALAAAPWTLLHGDYRLDNLLFRPEGEVVVLDLQGLGSGRPAVDVAYFITTALTAEHRCEEERLLRTYHDALVAAGVDDYAWGQLVRDCHLTKEMLAHRIVGAADMLDTTIAGEPGALMDMMQLRVLDWLR